MRFRILKNGKFPSLLLGGNSQPKKTTYFLINPVEGMSSKLRHRPYIQHFLLTQNSWIPSLAGLPGLLTDVQKSRKFDKEIFIHGPPGMNNLFKVLKYVLIIEDKSCLYGIEPRGCEEIVHFKFNQNWRLDENYESHKVTQFFEDDGIRIQHYSLVSNSPSFPSEIQYPAWNSLSINYKDEIFYPNDVPRKKIVCSYLISDYSTKVLILDIPDITYLDSLLETIPFIEANTVFDFSPPEVKEHEKFKEWSNSAIPRTSNIISLQDYNYPKEDKRNALKKLQNVYPADVIQYYSESSYHVNTKDDQVSYPKLTFLGTGSKRTGNNRNVSGILLRVSPQSCGLLDCGENTYHRLTEAFGLEETARILKTLRFIFISHRHNDHHLGLFTIIQERDKLYDGNPSKLYLIAPRSFKNLLKHYHGLFEDLVTSVFHINTMRLIKDSDKFLMSHLYAKFLKDTELDFCETLIAEHIKNSYSINLSAKGWKVLYTGDTKPNSRYRNKAPDVLIHEATLPSYLGTIAHQQLHSSTQDAIDAYKSSNAGFLILTHFSEAFDVVPHLEKVMISNNIAIAFDFVSVGPENLKNIAISEERFKNLLNAFSKEVFILNEREKRWNLNN